MNDSVSAGSKGLCYSIRLWWEAKRWRLTSTRVRYPTIYKAHINLHTQTSQQPVVLPSKWCASTARELVGFVSGVKGKLFELQYVDYLNDGHLPDGFRAELAGNPTNPGWDIAIIGQDEERCTTQFRRRPQTPQPTSQARSKRIHKWMW